MICETCQLYEAHLGRCLEYGLLTQMPATCPKYVEDAWIIMTKNRKERQLNMSTEIQTPPAAAPDFETAVLQLAREKKMSGTKIAKELGTYKGKVYKVLEKHGLHKTQVREPRNIGKQVYMREPEPGECGTCCHEVVCAIKEKAQANKDWAICRHWMRKEGVA